MTMESRITRHFEESGQLTLALTELLAAPINRAANMITHALLEEHKVLTCGNGTAAAYAQYFAALMLNRYEMERPGLAAIALCANSTTLSAIAHDTHFEKVYSKQVAALGTEGDILLAISATGNATNILAAINAAKERGMATIAISGGDGGDLVELLGTSDIHIGVPHDSVARVQETCVLILHCLCDTIDCLLLGEN